jgi:site-specific DNA-methyltransferase (adenine-specific)
MSNQPKTYTINIDELKPDVHNANKGTELGQRTITNSVAETGLHRGIVVDKNNRVPAGNKTLEAARKAGYKKAVVVETDGDTLVVTKRIDFDLTDSDPNNPARRAAYYDNASALYDIDFDPVVLLADVNAGIDFDNIFEDGFIDGCISQMEVETPFDFDGEWDEPSEPKIDKADELRQEYGVEVGQLWALGDHRLICGDCTDKEVVNRLLGDGSLDLFITDPPYGVDYASKNKYLNKVDKGNCNQTPITNDAVTVDEIAQLWESSFRIAFERARPGSPYYICSPQDIKMLSLLLAIKESGGLIKQQIIWVKNNRVLGMQDYHWKHEALIYGWKPGAAHRFYGGRSEMSTWFVDKPLKSEYHPTTKPVELFVIAIVNSSRIGDVVGDWFCGSGTTLIACEQLNRQCRAIELEPKYVGVTIKRWEELTGEKAKLIDKIEGANVL